MSQTKTEIMPICSHHIWFMGGDNMRCANCDLVITPEPIDIGELADAWLIYDAKSNKFEYVKL